MLLTLRLFLPISLAFAFAGVYAQDNPIFSVHKRVDMFNWQSIEKQMPKIVVTKFIQEKRSDFHFYGAGEYSLPIDSLYSRLHFVDLNNDGAMDVIYEGESDDEGGIVMIFMHYGGVYEKVFEERQNVYKMDWENGKLSRIFIDNIGCCADYVEFEKGFELTNNTINKPLFKQFYQTASAYIFGMKKPDSLFDKHFRFEVMNDNYNLRYQPVIDDTSFEPWNSDDTFPKALGNTIAKLPEGAKGTALAKQTDKTGRVWWYVEMDEQYPLKQYVLYQNQNKFPTKVKGWLSSRFVKVLTGD
jgi:hypothetical protein